MKLYVDILVPIIISGTFLFLCNILANIIMILYYYIIIVLLYYYYINYYTIIYIMLYL